MAFSAAHRFKSHYRQVPSRQEAFEQSLKKCSHRQADVTAEAEHKIQFAIAFGLLPKSAHQPVTHFVTGVVMPLGSAREGVRIAQQHHQRSEYVLGRAAHSISDTI